MESEELFNQDDYVLNEANHPDNIDVEEIAGDDLENVPDAVGDDIVEDMHIETGDGCEKGNLPSDKKRLVRLPLARVKHIIKMDPDCSLVSQDGVFLITKAMELFLEYLGRECAKYTNNAKRKTVQKRDLDSAIDSVPQLCFLEGALESPTGVAMVMAAFNPGISIPLLIQRL